MELGASSAGQSESHAKNRRPTGLPQGHGLFEQICQLVGIGGDRREFGDAVLRQGAFDEGGDVVVAKTEGGQAVWHFQFFHEVNDLFGQDLAGFFLRILYFRNIGSHDFGYFQVTLRIGATGECEYGGGV